MHFSTWEPVYESILADFGYDRAADEQARDDLADLATPFDLDRLAFGGDTVAVVGGAPTLGEDLPLAADADAVVATAAAADDLLAAGLEIDLLVTDLDSSPETVRGLAAEGVPVAVHAHGDNREAIQTWVPRFEPTSVLPTTQAAPSRPVRNFGGFTDGDRAAFLSDRVGAGRLRFPGWRFDDQSVGTEKRRKLAWAERLLYWLEWRRGDTFPVLDGRRDALSIPT